MKQTQKGFMALLPLVILTVVGLTGIGTVMAAEDSKPGDLLFPVKTAVNTVTHPFDDIQEVEKAEVKVETMENILDDNTQQGNGALEVELKMDDNSQTGSLEINSSNQGTEISGRNFEAGEDISGNSDEMEIRGQEVELRGRNFEAGEDIRGNDDGVNHNQGDDNGANDLGDDNGGERD